MFQERWGLKSMASVAMDYGRPSFPLAEQLTTHSSPILGSVPFDARDNVLKDKLEVRNSVARFLKLLNKGRI